MRALPAFFTSHPPEAAFAEVLKHIAHDLDGVIENSVVTTHRALFLGCFKFNLGSGCLILRLPRIQIALPWWPSQI